MLHGRDIAGTVAASMAALLLGACTVTLMAPYDSKTEQMVSALQSSFSAERQALLYSYGTPDCVYSRQTGFYQKAHADIEDLRVHVGVFAKNAQTIEMVGLLDSSLSALEAQHKRREETRQGPEQCMSAQIMEPDFNGLAQSTGAILMLEKAKQRGVPLGGN